jgi:hypothetical protein
MYTSFYMYIPSGNYYTLTDIGTRLGVSRQRVLQLMRKYTIEPTRIGTLVRYNEKAFLKIQRQYGKKIPLTSVKNKRIIKSRKDKTYEK